MTDPLSTLVNAIPGLTKAVAAIAEATDPHKRQTQFAELQQVLIQLNTNAFAIQTQNLSLLREKDDLEKQIVQLKNWKAEKQRYSLIEIHDGLVVYAVKESMSNGEAPHSLCANCFNNGKKSFLNTIDGARGFSMLACSVCKAQLQSEYRGSLQAQYAPG